MKNYLITITRVLLAGLAVLLSSDSVWSANPRSLSGVVQTGGTSSSQPLPNVRVTLFEATTGQPATLGQATTDGSGRFSIHYTRSTSQSIFFVQADVSEGVEFVTVLGPSLPTSITINELTTVAASYSMAQFLRTGVRRDLRQFVRLAARGRYERQPRRVRDRPIVACAIELAECGSDELTAFHQIARQFARGVRS
jgi:hypothetical protein